MLLLLITMDWHTANTLMELAYVRSYHHILMTYNIQLHLHLRAIFLTLQHPVAVDK